MIIIVLTIIIFYISSKNAMDNYHFSDPNSFARPEQIIVTHLHLELDVNFERKTLNGNVILSVKRQNKNITDLILDTKNLEIFNVTDVDTKRILPFELVKDPKIPNFLGHKLIIKLADASKATYNVSVNYETSPKSSALQWLLPQQTAGKTAPYLFSQSVPYHARSILPCQDTPSVRTTFTASISAPKTVNVLMSAVKDKVALDTDGDTKKHTFNQKVSIPSYLIAIVVGALENRKISDRIDVWSEKELVEKAAYEFAEAEKMLTIAEDLVGPYIWERYDILVLPPSFSFGGMENPCLTFISPTVLAGDRSLADVIAHEISHSWTGNLVTISSFEHFWLKEGLTVYLQRIIEAELHGEQYRQFQSIGGWKVLLDEIKTRGESDPFTKLVLDFNGKDPDNFYSSVPYEKGYLFLYYLEQKVGDRKNFTRFIRDLVDEYKFQSIDSETWKNFLLRYYSTNKELQSIDFDTWLHGSGMPPITPNYDQTLELACIDLSQKWMAAKEPSDFDQFSIGDMKGLHSAQIVEFLTLIRQNVESLSNKTLEMMQETYKLHSVENSNIKTQWIRLGLQSHWKEIIPIALKFVVEQGRMMYLKPIYRALYEWKETRQTAIDTFLKHRDDMMYQSANAVAKELHV